MSPRTCLSVLAVLAIAPLALPQNSGDSSAIPRRTNDPRFTNPTDPKPGNDGLAPYCAAVTATRPAPLAPGTHGALQVILSLKNKGVLPADGRVELSYEVNQGSLVLGRWSMAPAGPATLSPAYRGRAVHENTVTIEIPLAVASAATLGDHPVELTLDADVYNGETGTPICSGQLPIHAVVTVGRAAGAPIGARPGTAAPTAGDPGAGGMSGEGAQGDGTTGSAPGSPISAAPVRPAQGPGAPDNPDPTTAATPPPPSSDGDWLLVGTGGALLLVLLVLLLARRRSG